MVTGALKRIRDGLLGITYPAECRVCGGSVESWDDGVACADCWSNPALTPLFNSSSCQKCGLPDLERPAVQTSNCRACAALPFRFARACGGYAGALEASILFLKTRPYIFPRLTTILTEAYERDCELLESNEIVPVPLHRTRIKERGFNQASLVAHTLGGVFGIPVDETSLLRARHTDRHRAGLDAVDRAKSMVGAFEVQGNQVRGKSLLLVDDLLTTGSTITAATTKLLESGAVSVNVFTIARVIGRQFFDG